MPRPRFASILCVGILVSLGVFGSLAWHVARHQTLFFDGPILLFVHGRASPGLDAAMIFFTRLGSAFFLIPFSTMVFVVLAWRRRHRAAAFWALAIGGAILLNVPVKHALARTRPHLWISQLPETTFSFPSGHAVQSMAVVAALVLLSCPTHGAGRALALGVPFVFLVGLSRVYLGVHYPSDVLAGWTLALAWVCGLRLLFGESLDGMPSGPA